MPHLRIYMCPNTFVTNLCLPRTKVCPKKKNQTHIIFAPPQETSSMKLHALNIAQALPSWFHSIQCHGS